jgi:prolyl oligopeptidase
MRILIWMSLFSATAAAAATTWHYPAAPSDATVDDYHGTKVSDPYRPLEQLDALATQQWVAAENRLTFDFLKTLPQRAWIHRELTRLWDYPRFGVPEKAGGRYFFSKNSGLQNQSPLYVQASATDAPRLLLDPNTLSADGTVALSNTAVSPDGQWLAYATAAAGSDWTEIRVRNVTTGQDTSDLVQWIKFSAPSWTNDNRGFFYSRFPAPHTDAVTGKAFGDLAGQRLYYHRLGETQDRDQLIYEIPDQPRWLIGAQVSDDGRYAFIGISRGDSNDTLLSYIDLSDPAAPKVHHPVIPLIKDWTARYSALGNLGSKLYVQTNDHAARERIIVRDLVLDAPIDGPNSPDAIRHIWTTVVPESSDTIQSSLLAGGKLVVLTMHDASSRLRIFEPDGSGGRDVALPGLGTIGSITGRADDPELFYNFTSFTYPTANFRYDLGRRYGELYQAPTVPFDPNEFETKQIFYASKDGTRIPMFIVAQRGLKLDGARPTLLYAYGGFDISMTPAFSVSLIVWLKMGGVYALPNIRGGGEYGREWHLAGTKERKQNVFDDYIAAAETLFAQHYTSPEHLVLSGGSNGGLLVGATINQRPELCRVAWPAVGVMDMLRFQKFTIGWAWEADYGSSDDETGFKYLRPISPVHNVQTNARYPAVLITTADHDDRVFPAHSFKFAAALQAGAYNGPGALPVMIRIETRAGHGAGKPTSKQIDEAADKFAFAAHFLNLHPEMDGKITSR